MFLHKICVIHCFAKSTFAQIGAWSPYSLEEITTRFSWNWKSKHTNVVAEHALLSHISQNNKSNTGGYDEILLCSESMVTVFNMPASHEKAAYGWTFIDHDKVLDRVDRHLVMFVLDTMTLIMGVCM